VARKRNKNKREDRNKWHDGLKPETKQSVFAIASFALALLFTLAAFGKAGLVGAGFQRGFELLFGKAFFLVPLVFFLAGFSFLFSLRKHFVLATLIGGILFLLSALGIAEAVRNFVHNQVIPVVKIRFHGSASHQKGLEHEQSQSRHQRKRDKGDLSDLPKKRKCFCHTTCVHYSKDA